MSPISWSRRCLPAVLLLLPCAAASAQTIPANLYCGLVWRNIGPFRGGRVAAVSGVIGQPGVFYMGLPLGGVWKTTSAGTTWYPIFDSVKEASSVGAIEVAPSDPNTIYVGMGDMLTGGGINRGNGVYKSTDAGATWKHIGLDETAHIPSILVDPRNPDVVMVAAQGPHDKKSDARGLYRSTDGGATWTKTLYVDDETGVQKIAWAYDRPNVMLATTVRYYSPPGQGGRGGFGGGAGRRPSGPTARLYKSTDEGVTWKEITDAGLPELAGRTCVAVAMNTDARRMFLVGNFGLYRSDDAGTTWRQMDEADRRAANGQGGYNCGVYVNSQNPDIVYVINTCSYRSLDGGKTFTGFKGAPGGDDPQQMWIDPTDGSRLFFGTDQGATISLDAGQTWSSWYNQATAQVYHIAVDNQYPYWVYATQQDSGSIATASRGNLGEITPLDWLPHPGYEFGSIVADPLNPKISYAGGPGGGIVKATYPSGQWIDVSPSLDASLKLRKVGNQPLVYSPTNPHELLAGFQCVMATTDGGGRWRALSPDLTLRPGETPPGPARATPTRKATAGTATKGAPKARGAAKATPDSGPAGASGQQQYEPLGSDEQDQETGEDEDQRFMPPSAIESISVSSVDGKVMWAGTSNGLIKVSRDHGATWGDATIPDLPNARRADITAIDASHHDAAAAYAAVDCHGTGDYKPYLYRTHDYGHTWTSITNGLPTDQPSGSFARVIRADTGRQGLLFAGTESSVYVSFDDGDHWQSLALNLPNTSYRDMIVKGSDLVVGTYGRGFWILDDISPLRQIARSMAGEPAHLFTPVEATRVRRNVNDDTPFPPEVPHALNPPAGVTLYYSLGSAPAGDVTLDIRDDHGTLIRHVSSRLTTTATEPPPPVPDFWVETPKPLPTVVGLNRTSWDLRCDSPPAFNHSYQINANPGETPASPEGPLVPPGKYEVTLSVDGKSYREPLIVRNDPRSPATTADLRKQFALQMKLYDCSRKAWLSYHEIAVDRESIAAVLKGAPAPDVATAAHSLDDKFSAIEGTMGFGRGFRGFGGPPRQPTFATAQMGAVRQLETLDWGDMAPNDAMRKACATQCEEMDKLMKQWAALQTKDLPALNAVLTRNHLKPVGTLAQAGVRDLGGAPVQTR